MLIWTILKPQGLGLGGGFVGGGGGFVGGGGGGRFIGGGGILGGEEEGVGELVEIGGEGVLQHGPIQCGFFFLSFDVLRLVHLMCSQLLHLLHSTDVCAKRLVHIGQ